MNRAQGHSSDVDAECLRTVFLVAMTVPERQKPREGFLVPHCLSFFRYVTSYALLKEANLSDRYFFKNVFPLSLVCIKKIDS